MNPLAVFVLAFFLWLSKGLYLRSLVKRLSRVTNELVAYWSVVSAVDVLLAVLVTLFCPNVYFIRWDFPLRAFLVVFALSVLSALPSLGETLKSILNPTTEDARKMAEFIENSSFSRLTFVQVISSALPEEIIFRYVFLGLRRHGRPLA